MLGYLVLLALQLAGAWFIAPQTVRYIPLSGDLKTFVYAAVFAVLVWIIGVVGSQVLKDVRMPSSSTLALSLVLALIGAALVVFLPGVRAAIPLNIPSLAFPLIGAVLGYMLRRG
ncbi:MAG: hypothetical protein ACRBCJ_01465 [Hyphomicrobiaceae bacterium]